jgi:UDP-N-acetylglucosamine--dolichyl-phosphate N-acetylglucosaminephosphotransferase
LFPKVRDIHKSGRPLVPNGVGVLYVLISTIYLFLLHYTQSVNSTVNQSFPALDLAVCILFGGFMGLLDDWMDLRWRYKAFLPIFAALPLGVLRQGTPIMATYFWGKINFSEIMFWVIPGEMIFYLGVIPLIATVTTNTVNQLGGLNGLETICPSIALIALMLASSSDYRFLLFIPLAVYLILALFNFQGKIFVGNTGSFAMGITLASYAIIANIEQTLLISILPYIFNSSLILINVLLLKRRPRLKMEGNILKAEHRRSLVTLIAYYYPTTERKLVLIISSIFFFTTTVAVLVAA